MRENYFKQKDVLMEMGVVIKNSLKDQLTFEEGRTTDSKIVIKNFNEMIQRMKNLIQSEEMTFLIKCQQLSRTGVAKNFSLNSESITGSIL